MDTNINKIVIEDGFCYPCYPILDEGNLFICLKFTELDSPEHICKYSEVRCINLETKNTKWIFKLKDEEDFVNSTPILYKDKFICTTNKYIIALDKNSGNILWQVEVPYKLWTTNLSVIDDLLYLYFEKELKVLNCENGKTLKTKKYKVHWLCGSIVKYNDRLFVSTSNSKIIGLNLDTLEIENEYKFPGSWSIDSTPSFTNNLMLSNSYSAYAICFDLSTNEPLWRVKKTAGSQPNQLLDDQNQLFFIVEASFYNPKLSAINIKNGKKLWNQDYFINDFKNLDNNNIIGLLKNESGQYFIACINKQNGMLEKEFWLSKYIFDERFEHMLWDGAEIIVEKELVLITYSPNEIFVINKEDIINN
ncbi:PQQ-binding-like beta-propeller repeat protein [Sphingobacterium lactis]|uniref:outer membrane protein assembly factor BamB family protein n=1 Tax=Sphingobacterium lactis TaxID=797291 RepID=UPI003F80104A